MELITHLTGRSDLPVATRGMPKGIHTVDLEVAPTEDMCDYFRISPWY